MYKLIKPLLLLLLSFGLALPTLLQAAEPPIDPILRIETGMHTAPINSISVDAAEQFLVTASDDKTLRLWELATGKLLTTYRVPMGEGNEGKLYATVISPDGLWVAGAGWTGAEWNGNYSIYLFNRQTGELERRLSGLEQVILHLCVSPDGQYLAATLGGSWGLRIWNTQTWQPVFRDNDYGDSSYWCDFDVPNRLVTTSWDGVIRLYILNAGTFNLTAKSEAPGGKLPYSAAFSPSNDQIAVGFVDSTSVNVLDGSTLALLYAPDTSGVDNGDLSSVAWSQDGQGLYAGGRYYNSKGIVLILYWMQPAQSSYREWPAVTTDSLTDLRALKGWGVVYGAPDPAFGVLDKDGNKVLERQSDIANYRGIFYGNFGLSSEGSSVQFAFKEGGKHPARFSVAEQQLTLSLLADNSLRAPDTTSLDITNWQNSNEPQLNGVSLPLWQLWQDEFSRSLAIAPDHSKFLLGTEWYLRLFDATGYPQLWEVQVSGVAWGVNISGDGKIGLAALGDGTLRWYQIDTGQELLAWFPHKDEKRWIAWTRSGYYMSSGENANNLIGWQVNNGKDQAASFYPISALNTDYNRPDIVKKVLTTLDEVEAIRLANLERSGEVEPPSGVREGLEKVNTQYQVVLTPSGLGKAIIVAASGEQDSNSLFPYTNEFTQEMYRFLHDQGFSDGDIIYLNPLPPVVPSDGYTDIGRQDFPLREPTQELEQAMAKARQELQAGQRFIFYWHGHADPKSLRIGQQEELSAEQLKTLLAPIPTNVQQTIILDTCHSGSFLTELAGVPNRILIASADADALAWSTQDGSFSEYFIRYLRNGKSLGESFDFAKSEMAKDSKTFGNQSPQLDDTLDGSYDPTLDGQLARLTFLGGQTVYTSLPPEIVTVHPPIQLATGQKSATLWVTVVPSFEAIQQVHAILTNEHDQTTEYQGQTTLFTRREISLKPNYSLQRYEVEYNQFNTANSWKIRYEAQSMEGDWSEIKVGYVLAEGAAIPTKVQAVINNTTYHVGDPFRFEVTIQGTEIVDLYAGVIFPQEQYYTLAYPATFSQANTFQPYQREVALLGESTLQVLNLTLPVVDKGEYQACALLTKPAADPKRQENWLSFHCQSLQVQ